MAQDDPEDFFKVGCDKSEAYLGFFDQRRSKQRRRVGK
jgi:hypothetical protein